MRENEICALDAMEPASFKKKARDATKKNNKLIWL